MHRKVIGLRDTARISRAARDAFEPLEQRLLMSFSAHVNFQPASARVPSGYVADAGWGYGARNGLTYGWNQTNTYGRERFSAGDQRYDTLAQMQPIGAGKSFSWQIAVPNGTYKVHLVAGDPSYTNSVYKISAEGTLLVNGTPTASHKYVEGTANITVRDGKLTISNAWGSRNNKLSYIDITPVSSSTSTSSTSALRMSPAAPSGLVTSGVSSSQIRLAWRDNSTRETNYYVDRSTDNGLHYTRIATLGAGSRTFLDGGRTSGKTYYYRVGAHNAYGTSWVYGAGKTAGSSATGTVPAGPSGLVTSGASTTQIRLAWRDNSTRESGYYVERSTDNGKTYVRIATLGANSKTFLDGGRTAGKTYYYRVSAFNSAGRSPYTTATGRTLSSTSSGTMAPAAPSNFIAVSSTTTQIKLYWHDNSTRESGFYIERSSDGGRTYSRIATVGANTNTFLSSGLTSNKTYYYRVASFASGKISPWRVDFATTKGSTSTPPPPTPPITNSGYFDGVAIGMGGDVAKAIPILRALNIKAVRLWDGLSSWSNRWKSDPVLQNAIKYHNAGFKVTLLTTTTKPPTYSQAKAYFDWVQTVPGLKGAVDFWEIGNEPDLTKYYQGTLEHYVANELRGAWDSLHPSGEKVIGGAPIFPSNAQRAKDAGYLNYVDYANVHPYNSTVSGLKSDFAKFKAVFNSKPLVATEWNFHYVTDHNQWASMVSQIHPFLDDYFAQAYYFGFEVNGTGSGAGGLVYDGSYAKNTAFYNAVDSWYSSTSSAAAASSTSSSSSSSGSGSATSQMFSESAIL
jgi:fibronectin type 3 domain-containing protein